uniref:Cytochrome p450 n=1 Tax=Heterorhabditis bacteriophora TaxID=37862 RepID=A0A1I7WY31_HETBA
MLRGLYNFAKLYIKHFDYWTDRGIPGPKPSLFIGNLPDIAKIEYPVTLRIREWTQKYGKVYGFFEGYRKVLVISDLDMLQEMFVKKFDYFYGRKLAAISGNVDDDPRVHVFESRGSRWKRLRSLANPVFTVNSLKKIRHTVEDSALHLVNHMAKHADKDAFNIHEYVFLRDENNPWFYTANIIPYIGSLVRDTLLFVGKTTGTLPFTIVYDQVTKAVEDRIKQRVIRKKLQDEIDTFCNDESINYETLSSMKYLDCVVKEALRMYPLVYFSVGINRTSLEECILNYSNKEKLNLVGCFTTSPTSVTVYLKSRSE